MNKIGVLTHLVSQRNEATFEQKRRTLILRVMIVSSIIIFFVESLVMFALEAYLFRLNPVMASLMDGLTLVLILLPINYLFIVRPMMKQIEEHHRTNTDLRKSNELLEQFFSLGDILIAYLDTDFNFIRVNRAYSATDQRPAAEYIGQNHFDLFPNEENQRIFEAVVRSGKPYYALERPFTYAEHPERGTTYWDWSLLPVKDADRQVTALILVLTNVTERKEAQLALEASERRVRAVFDQTFQQSVLMDPQGKVLFVNQTALEFSGLRPEQMQGKAIWELPWLVSAPPATLTDVTGQIQAAVQQAREGTIVRREQRVRAAGGEIAIMDTTIKPVLDERGSPFLLVFEARDVTSRVQAEEALIRSEALAKRQYLAEMQARGFADTLRSAVLALSGSLDSGTVFELLLDHLHHVISYTSAHILLLEDENRLVVRKERGAEDWQEGQALLGRHFEVSDVPYLQPLLAERRLLNVSDTLLHDEPVLLADNPNVISVLGIPLLAGEQVIGVCLLEHQCPGFFNNDLIHWATALTGQAAVAIQNAWLFEQVRDGRQHLQALTRRLVEVQESERRYIARELHDDAGQALASLMIGLRHLEREKDDPPSVVARSQELKQIADGVLENLHRLAVDLRPAALDHFGLVSALRQHASRFSDEYGITVQFEKVGNIDRLPGEIETTIYRIVQEGLTNVARHANATRVDILIERRGDALVVVVEDNGVGFDPLSQAAADHLGLIGIRERAEMVGGQVTFESAPGKGATLFLEVPCQFES